jgi:tetratricopeptide (TPR) repeat protein
MLCLAVQDAQDLYRSGVEKHERGDLPGARDDLSKAIEAKPDFADAYFRRGAVLLDQKEYVAATSDLSRAVELAPKSGYPYLLRAKARMGLNDLAGAGEDASRAIELGVKPSDAYEIRGVGRFRRKDYAGALEDFNEVLRLSPANKRVSLHRGVARLHLGDPRGALVDLTDAIEAQPRDLSHFVRGWCYAALGSWENARRDFRRASELDSEASLEPALVGWLARVRAGERPAADEELSLRHREAPAKEREAPAGRIAAYLLGTDPESELLDKLGASKADLRARFWIAMKRTADGDADGARPFLEKVAPGTDLEAGVARHLLRERQAAERRRAVEALEAKARTLTSFHAEFELVCPSHAEEGKEDDFDPHRLVVDGDLEARRFLLRLIGTQGAEEKTAHFLLEGEALTAWGFEPRAYRMALGDFFKRIDGMYDALFQDLDRLVPPEKKEDAPEPGRGISLLLDLEPKPSKEERGALRAAVLWSGRPFSWLAAAAQEGPAPSRDGPLVLFDLPRQKKRISLDEATGFLAGIEATDYDGKTRRLVRRRFAAAAEFPDLVVPAKPVAVPVPFDPLQRYLLERHESFGTRLAAVLDRWDRLVQEEKQPQAQALATSWAAHWLDAWHSHLVRLAARQHLKGKLESGATLEDLFRTADDEAGAFGKRLQLQRQELRTHLAAALSSLRTRVRSHLIGLPIDNRRHGTLKAFLDGALDFERVEAHRSKGDATKIDRIFREELEAHKRL